MVSSAKIDMSGAKVKNISTTLFCRGGSKNNRVDSPKEPTGNTVEIDSDRFEGIGPYTAVEETLKFFSFLFIPPKGSRTPACEGTETRTLLIADIFPEAVSASDEATSVQDPLTNTPNFASTVVKFAGCPVNLGSINFTTSPGRIRKVVLNEKMISLAEGEFKVGGRPTNSSREVKLNDPTC